MIRRLSLFAAIILLTLLWAFTLWILQEPPTHDPALWNQYSMNDLRGH
jgi:hypothetical protein